MKTIIPFHLVILVYPDQMQTLLLTIRLSCDTLTLYTQRLEAGILAVTSPAKLQREIVLLTPSVGKGG